MEATLLGKLHSSSDLSGIRVLFTEHLHPFTPFFKASPTTTTNNNKRPWETTPPVAPLASKYSSFIQESLVLLSKRLSESPKVHRDSASELFNIFSLCLQCFDVIALELGEKPYLIQEHRLRYIHCLEHWELYDEEEAECSVVLESLNAIVTVGGEGRSRESQARLVPELNESVDREFAAKILETVIRFVGCASKKRSKAEEDYRRVLLLVTESHPWFKILDAEVYSRFHCLLETHLHTITLFLVAEINSFSLKLICEFSLSTLEEYKRSSAQDKMYQVALNICSSLSSQENELYSDTILGVLEPVLDFVAQECQAFPSIRRSSSLVLQAAELLASSSNNKSKGNGMKKRVNASPALKVLLSIKQWIQLFSLDVEYMIHFTQKGILPSDLKLFCESFAKFLIANWKEILSDEADSSLSWHNFNGIQDAFHHFCNFHLCHPSSTGRERGTLDIDYTAIYTVFVATILLSFRTNQKIKESTLFLELVVSAEWIPVKRLRYLYVTLHSVAVTSKEKKWLKEAVIAFRLCCKAAWNYAVNLCKMHVNGSHLSDDDLSENAIADFVKEAMERSAFFLELNQEVGSEISEIIKESLKCWSVAENMILTLPIPASLVRKWVKLRYSLLKDKGEDHGTTLYSLISSSKGVSTRTLGKLLEEELVAYDEMIYLDQRYCLKMSMEVISILLQYVYTTVDTSLERSKILIQKGKLLRAHGSHPDEYIPCLSDAISTLESAYTSRKSFSLPVHHLLMHAYILRALCTHEATPSAMLLSTCALVQDIHGALKLHMSQDHGHADEQYEDMLYLWYQLIDLLSIKGYLEFHPSLYEIMIKLFNKKNFPMAKTMSQLWKSRRLSHALCASPISKISFEIFSKHQSLPYDTAEFWRTCISELKPLVVGFHQSNDEIKQAAFDLKRHVTSSSSCSSIFLLSCLYYELAGRLISSGQIIEALTYGKVAYELRLKLMKQKFKFSTENKTESFVESGKTIERSYPIIRTFRVNDVVSKVCDYEGCIVTPWNVLGCYLESILQVAIVQEVLGNANMAEWCCRWGKNISQIQGLPLFEVSFSIMLGQLSRKQKLWSMAEKELFSARKILTDARDIISCSKCSCVLGISIDQQLGDLYLSRFCSIGETPMEMLLKAKGLYRSALIKLNLSMWRTYGTTEEEAGSEAVSETKVERKRSRRTKKELNSATQEQDNLCVHNPRVTRSTHRASREALENLPGDIHIVSTVGSGNSSVSDDYDLMPNSECSIADFQNNITLICNKMRCWHCLRVEAVDNSSLSNFMYMTWELVHRKLCLKLLARLGKSFGICGNDHEAHEILLQSISVLFNANSSCGKHTSDSLVSLLESIGKHFPGDGLAAERAALLYYICWFATKSYQGTREMCCELTCIGEKGIVSLLKLAFILCREVPLLFCKISRLLAAIYILSTSCRPFSLSPSEDDFPESRWASFFHQASLGAHLNQRILSGVVQKKQGQAAVDSKDVPSFLRLAPECCEDLKDFVISFFEGLPSTPVICISLVAGDDACLLRRILPSSSTVRAWVLLSHMTSDDQYVVLLPIYKTFKGPDDCLSGLGAARQWECPWVSSVIDDVAPVFRDILKLSFYSFGEGLRLEKRRDLWKSRRKVDEILGDFLLELEELWLGTWKYLLLGEWPDCTYLDSIQKNLSEDEAHLLRSVVTKRCYVGGSEPSLRELENTLQLLFKEKHKSLGNLDQNSNPIILVLDLEVHMLPWENLPTLRNREVYRLLSVRSIYATLDRCCRNQQEVETRAQAFPLIDPLDSYYLLNPEGDLNMDGLDYWLKDKSMEGNVGSIPSPEELTLALKSHDLFI